MQSVDIATTVAAVGNGLHFDTQPCLFSTLEKWLGHVPDAYSDAKQQARLVSCSWHSTALALQHYMLVKGDKFMGTCACVYFSAEM